jgi:ABC-type branched-subunit amino acid transport system substrate-binding protein
MAEETRLRQRSTIWLRVLNFEIKEWLISPFPAAIVAAIALTWIIAWLNGPSLYYIYVVSAKPASGEPESRNAQLFWEGFQNHRLHLTKFRGVDLDIKEEHEESGSQAIPLNAQSISATLARRNDTLLVVLFLGSSRTKEVLPEYLQATDPPIPTVLTWQTNPDLLPPKLANMFFPVLQMWPTDDAQADNAAKFPKPDHGVKPRFWVVEDTSNPTYSQFLADRFIEQAEQNSGEVLLRSNSLSLPTVQTISDLRINWVFFTGSSSDALILARQLSAIESQINKGLKETSPRYKRLRLILSDTSVDDRLKMSSDLNDVYVTYPMPASEYNSDKGLKQLGNDASEIVEELVKGADGDQSAASTGSTGGILVKFRTALGIQRVSDARNALISYMQKQRQYHLSENEDTTYTFDEEGKRKDGRFYVWEVKNGQFIEADEGSSDRVSPNIAVPARKSNELTIGTNMRNPKLRIMAGEVRRSD